MSIRRHGGESTQQMCALDVLILCEGILMSLTYTHKFLGINKHFNGNNHLLMAFLLYLSLFLLSIRVPLSLHASYYYRDVSSRLYLIHLTLQI